MTTRKIWAGSVTAPKEAGSLDIFPESRRAPRASPWPHLLLYSNAIPRNQRFSRLVHNASVIAANLGQRHRHQAKGLAGHSVAKDMLFVGFTLVGMKS